ncbi:hypothetical protein, partial [Halothiobacillus sp.]|uniref:hypothetical protein n=1 Tax=Halothiobacillus sp. TaxID=1891311 RepID=UPI003D11B872
DSIRGSLATGQRKYGSVYSRPGRNYFSRATLNNTILKFSAGPKPKDASFAFRTSAFVQNFPIINPCTQGEYRICCGGIAWPLMGRTLVVIGEARDPF